MIIFSQLGSIDFSYQKRIKLKLKSVKYIGVRLKLMDLVVSGTFAEVTLAIDKLRTVFEVLKTIYYVSADETVQVLVCVKLPTMPLAETLIDKHS